MPSLVDLASDLINKAKLAQDSRQKLYNMEQVKEIIFHRDTSLLQALIPELFELMLERSIPVRRFLVKIGGDSLRQDISLTPKVLSLYSFLVVDGNDKILQSIALELSNYYGKISIFVAKMSTKTSGSHHQNDQVPDPRDLWHQLRSMTSLLIETIASNRTEALRIQCLKLCESVILFGLPPSVGTGPKDPRMARAAGAGGRTLLEIPLHHAFIDRNDVEKEADSTLSKMVLWARRGGPQGFLFPAQVMSQLGQSIGAIAAERIDRFKVVVPALIFLIQGPKSLCPQMNAASRQQISLTLDRLIRAAAVAGHSADPDGLSTKLQEALSGLDKLNAAGASDVTGNPDPRKRKADDAALADAAVQGIMSALAPQSGRESDDEESEEEDAEEGDDDELDEDGIKASALAAVDAAESHMQQSSNKKLKIDDLLGTNPLSIVAGGHGIGAPAASSLPVNAGLFSPTSAESGCTVPANDLGAFPSDATTSMRLMTLKQVEGSGGSKQGTTFESVTPPGEVYSELAMGSLSKMLSSAIEPVNPPRLKSILHVQLLLRTVLAMARTDINTLESATGSGGTASTVLHIAVLKSRSVSSKLLGDADGSPRRLGRVPMDVPLPRSIWLYLSHCLQAQENPGPSVSGGPQRSNRESNTDFFSSLNCDRLDLILALAREIYACMSASREGRLLSIPCEYVSLNEEDEQEGGMDESEEVAAVSPADNDQLEDDEEMTDIPLYDTICLVVLTRMLQRKKLRPLIPRVLLSLPSVPLVCIHLLELLLLTGTKSGSAGTQFGMKKRGSGSDRGMRMAVLDIMGNILLNEKCMADPNIFRACLFPILWLATSDDFSLRTAAVNSLVGVANKIDRDYEPGEGLSFVRTAIVMFSLQLGLTVVGIDSFKLRQKQRAIDFTQSKEEFLSDESIFELFSDLDFENCVDLPSAGRFYNGGKLFGNKFDDIYSVTSDGEVESFSKRALHLVLQLSLSRPSLLVSLLDLYGVSYGIQQCQLPDKDISESLQANISSLPSRCGETICSLLQREVLNITPAVTSSSRDTDGVFESLLQADLQALPMLILVLNSVLVDLEIPASDHMVQIVTTFFRNLPEESRDVRLLIPILGGMTGEDVEKLLPQLINGLDDDAEGSGGNFSEYMGKCIARITRARPPPLSKANLLVALHRIDNEEHGIVLKTLLTTIGLCLSDRAEFKSDVIREAVTILLEDSVPPKALMRTVMLSAQNLPDIKKFVLSVVVPKLVMKRTWSVAPKVWDGVVMCVKTMASHRDSEPTIRALLGLPLPQLKGILKIATDAGSYLSRLLRTLSEEEVEEALSGKWAGLEQENSEEQKAEKAKLIRGAGSSSSSSRK